MKRVLITSGGTKVKIDMVRHIANMSSGTFGAKIALESLKLENNVLFFKAKNSKNPPVCKEVLIDLQKEEKYKEEIFEYFEDYNSQIDNLILNYKPDIIVLAAAVSDYGVVNYVDGKIRSKSDLTIHLTPYPKVISKIKALAPNAKLVGFKLLVNSTDEELLNAANESMYNNKCDMVVANDLRDIKNNNHRVYIVTKKAIELYLSDPKDSNFLARKVVEAYNEL